jgi:radical SAM protein with 4Fe4S-binding SPASM domain
MRASGWPAQEEEGATPKRCHPNLRGIRDHMCSTLLDRVSIGYDGTVYPCPETMKRGYTIVNVHDQDAASKFDARHAEVLDSLKKREFQDYWFGNLMDVCIGRVYEDSSGCARIDDAESISMALEEVLYQIAVRKHNGGTTEAGAEQVA